MIYHLLPEFEPFSSFRGGAVARNVANMMMLDGSSVVCSSSDQSWPIDSSRVIELSALRAFARLRGRRYLPLWMTGEFFRKTFAPLLARLGPGDIVHCHSQPDYCAALERSIHGAGAKLIFHSHSPLAFYESRPHFRAFVADAYIFVSRAMEKEALTLFPFLRNTYTVYNGADERIFFPPVVTKEPRQELLVLFVGRVHATKGVHILSEAMRILESRECTVRCKVIGSSFAGNAKTSTYMKRLMRDRPKSMSFESFLRPEELAREYRAADIFCCPSTWAEPFGNVLVEAMASGLPVVASLVGGIPEVASEGGFLLVPPNRPEELADALQELIENEELRARLSRKGREAFLRRFPWSVVVAQHQEIARTVQATSIHMADCERRKHATRDCCTMVCRERRR